MTTAQLVRVGVVGAGDIARTHLHALADAGNPAVAVTDIDAQRAEAAAVDHGATAYSDVTSMLAEADLDGAIVCTPPIQHPADVLRCIDTGVAVLCEKPMARSPEECRRMVQAAEAAECLLMVGFCHRFQPHIEALRTAAQGGQLGTILSVHNRFTGVMLDLEDRWYSRKAVAGGGVLMNNGVHSIDLFRYLIGDVDEVRALAATTASDIGPALEIDDTAALIARSNTGVLGVFEAGWRTRPASATVTIQGTEGTMHFDYPTMTLTRHDGRSPAQVLEIDRADRFTRQAEHFVACIRGTAKPRVTGHDGAVAVDLITSAYESAGAVFGATA